MLTKKLLKASHPPIPLRLGKLPRRSRSTGHRGVEAVVEVEVKVDEVGVAIIAPWKVPLHLLGKVLTIPSPRKVHFLNISIMKNWE